VSVDDDVMKSDRHAHSLLDTLEGIPQNALFCRPYGKLSPTLSPGMAQRGVARYARWPGRAQPPAHSVWRTPADPGRVTRDQHDPMLKPSMNAIA
jgi:hypothetical protein